MTRQQISELFKGVKLVFNRAGADTISEWTPRKAKKCFLTMIEDGETITTRFTRLNDILFLDAQSWVEING